MALQSESSSECSEQRSEEKVSEACEYLLVLGTPHSTLSFHAVGTYIAPSTQCGFPILLCLDISATAAVMRWHSPWVNKVFGTTWIRRTGVIGIVSEDLPNISFRVQAHVWYVSWSIHDSTRIPNMV